MTRAVMALFVIAALLASTEALAQGEEWEDPGLWVAAGGGYGLASTDCVRCSEGSLGSFAVILGVGGSASRKIRFGIEGVGWFQSAADTAREYIGVVAIVQWFPVEKTPLSIQVGVGGGRYAEEGGGDLLEASGFSLQIGANYDYYFSRNIAVRPFARYLFAGGLTTKVNRQVQFTDLNYGLLYFGVALTWVKL
jgi:hypothetical protein